MPSKTLKPLSNIDRFVRVLPSCRPGFGEMKKKRIAKIRGSFVWDLQDFRLVRHWGFKKDGVTYIDVRCFGTTHDLL